MEQRMLIEARHLEECRIAITENGKLADLEVESQLTKKLKGTIFKARIVRIEPSLQAAFVDIGSKRNGFLQINDIHPAYLNTNGGGRRGQKPRIQDMLKAGQELIVQVVKEEREMKGATLTTYLSIPGRYVVLMPGSDRGGISRKINDGLQRQRLRALSEELELPIGVGIIIRTAGLDRSLTDLSRDLQFQLKVWEKIVELSQTAQCPEVLYAESDVALRVVRDYFNPEMREIVIDEPKTFERVKEFVGQTMPRYKSRVKLYQDPKPLMTAFGIEDQISSTLSHNVQLPSGGFLIIQQLEALVAIDVNSGKSTSGFNIEETAYKTNLEAAMEVCRQLRLRDMGGLIVIDFIDMNDRKHRSQVERALRDAAALDKARVEIGQLSRFGLLEMSRQRIRATLSSQSHVPCPHCAGIGVLRSPELVAIEVLRRIQLAVLTGSVEEIRALTAPAVALFLLNTKKRDLVALETEFKTNIAVIADGRLRVDDYKFEIDAHAAHQEHVEDYVGNDGRDDGDETPLTLLDDEPQQMAEDDDATHEAEAPPADAEPIEEEESSKQEG